MSHDENSILLYVQEVVSDPFCIVSYYIKWVTTSWTYCMIPLGSILLFISPLTVQFYDVFWYNFMIPSKINFYDSSDTILWFLQNQILWFLGNVGPLLQELAELLRHLPVRGWCSSSLRLGFPDIINVSNIYMNLMFVFAKSSEDCISTRVKAI